MELKEMVYKSEQGHEVLCEDTHNGYRFCIESLGSHPVAYVEIPKDHVAYRSNELIESISCHGGITYIGYGKPNEEGVDSCWIGWDYAHWGDYMSLVAGLSEDDKKWTTEEIFEEVKHVISQLEEFEKF